MLTIWGNRTSSCDGLSRRNFLRIGGLGLTGLTLADMLRLDSHGASASAPAREPNAVIMIGLPGGPSQFEMYDLKPDAPREIAGELRPISTNVPGFQISELFPLQAQIADKLAVVRGVDFYFDDAHSQQLIYTGYGRPFNVGTPIRGRMPRPAFGCVYSCLRGATALSGLPSYVSMIRSTAESGSDAENPAYAGTTHRAFTTGGKLLDDLRLPSGMTLDRLTQRREMLTAFDVLRRDVDHRSQLASADAATMRAWEALATSEVRDAFDLSQEPESVRAKYGKIGNKGESGSIDPEKFLLARRLVEAGVKVVTLQVGSWDTHSGNFTYMHRWLPVLDRAIHGLVTDLHERGLDKHVAVLMWGEMGRTPRINNNPGRDHWADSGFAFFAGGGAGLKMGQAISQTDSRGERASGKRYTVQNVLATVYHVLGIDPATTLRDHSGRPQYLLDEREKISELL